MKNGGRPTRFLFFPERNGKFGDTLKTGAKKLEP